MAREITLEELFEKVKEKEAITKEPQAVTNMLWFITEEIVKAAQYGKVTILSDYDADGICSAYIIEHTLKAINPYCDVTSRMNDRRGQYGLAPNTESDGKSRYIVLDMGSNQLDFVREKLGEDTIIIDHHLIEDESIRRAFNNQVKDCYNEEIPYKHMSAYNKCLCNPHAFEKNDEDNAQYCTTGLAYRVYETAITMEKATKICDLRYKFDHDEKLDNTMLVMACIGTVTDMVSVLDTNSKNREIIKKGLKTIDNADENNLDFVIGSMLAKNKIENNVTAYTLAFNVGAFINSASRMSEVINANGAEIMYNMLNGKPYDFQTYKTMDKLMDYNAQRKMMVANLTKEPEYRQFIEEHRYGSKSEDNIGIYQLPDNVPAAFAGLIAGKLTEATDKAIICLTYKGNDDNGNPIYVGSGRNAESNETSLIKFLEKALEKKPIDIVYGGHKEAIGISKLVDLEGFKEAVESSKELIQKKPEGYKTILKISPSEIASSETLNILKMLEPTGEGLKIPPAIIEGTETLRDKLFMGDNKWWKTVKIKSNEKNADGKPVVISTKDWCYSPSSYPQSGKKENEIATLVSLGLDSYMGLHTGLTTKFDRVFLAERLKKIELEKAAFQKSDKEIIK